MRNNRHIMEIIRKKRKNHGKKRNRDMIGTE
jgi:hypothetical protein